MRAAFICFLINLFALSVPAGQPGQDKKELDALQGTWLVEELIVNGMDFSEKFKFSLVIKGDFITVKGDEQVQNEYGKISFKLDAKTKPKSIELKVVLGNQQDATMEGIYQFKDDRLILCVKPFGNDGPTEFKSPPGEGVVLLTLKRQKDKQQ